jgi:cytochrome c553
MRLTLSLLLLGLTVSGLGCGGGEPPARSPEAGPAKATATEPEPSTARGGAEPSRGSLEREAAAKPDLPPSGASVERIMRAHFKDALLIRQAVIAGHPEEAAKSATVLTLIQNLDDLPQGWRPFVERMQADAARARDATSAAQTAAATADLGLSCGACHQRFGGPRPSTDPPPTPGSSVESRMKSHAWATERLWEGLTVPSDDAWQRGAVTLDSSAFPEEVLKKGGVHARNAASELAKLVVRTRAKKTPGERAAHYAELLVTCGACHRAVADGG